MDQDTRWLLFIYATKVKGVTYRELGITPAMGNMIKNRKRTISDDVLLRVLNVLTLKDLLDIIQAYNEWDKTSQPARARRLAWLGRRPHTAEQLLDLLYEFLYTPKKLKPDSDVIILPGGYEGFRAWLQSQGKSKRTIRERINYLKRLSSELGHRFTLNQFYKHMAKQQPRAREHYLKALRLYLRYINRKDLLERLKGGWTPSSQELKTESVISLEEAYDAIRIAAGHSLDYALYLATLLVTGLRPHEVRMLRWNKQILPQVFRLEKKSRLKRAYHAFLTPNVYVELLRTKRGDRVVHYRRETEYNILLEIKKEIPQFRPYELRALNAALLFKAGLPESIVKYMHGWSPISVVRRYYLDKQLGLEEMLEDLLAKHNKALASVDERINEILGGRRG